jgi:hypothetical protein
MTLKKWKKMLDYSEPELSILVLDFVKPDETRACLESISKHVKFETKVIYLHNGPAPYPFDFYREGRVDTVIQKRFNDGLGVGTRDLVAICSTKYFMMLQNDQIIARDFYQRELDIYTQILDSNAFLEGKWVKSIGLAGHVAGHNIYSERSHIMETEFYKGMERELPLSPGGAGPYHHQQWREGQIQEYYKQENYLHLVMDNPLVLDRGVWTIRDVGGGRVKMRTDTKAVWWLIPPTESYIFPEMTEQEWRDSICGNWKDGTIPQTYLDKRQSFNCWGEQKA